MSKQMLYGRLAFPYIFEPRTDKADPSKKPRYELTLLIDKTFPGIAKYKAACLEVAVKKFGNASAAQAVLQARPVFKDGSAKAKPVEGFADHYYIAARSTTMPDFFGPDRRKLSTDEARKLFYAGCYVNVIVSPWAYSSNGNRGVSHELVALQFAGHGDAFSGRPTASADDFPDVSAQAGETAFATGADDLI